MDELRPGWNAAHGYVLPEPPDNASIRWGLGFEDAIVRLAEERAGKRIIDRERFFERDFITCHIDGLYEDGTLHEGKTTTAFSFHDEWGEPGSDRLPQSYQIQCQGNMALSGATSAIVTVLVFPRRPDEWEAAGIVLAQRPGPADALEPHVMIPRRPPDSGHYARTCYSWAMVLDEMGYFHQFHVPALPSLQAELVRAYAEWWVEYVVGEKEPPLRTYPDIQRLCPAPKGTVVADEQATRWALEYKEIGTEIGDSGRLARRRDELKLLLLQWMRAQDAAMDEESREKTVLRDAAGAKLAQWNGKVFRT